MLTESRTINVLGTDVKIVFQEEKDDAKLLGVTGYYDFSENLIVVKIPEKEAHSVGNLENAQKYTLRHEIIHAFLFESGLDGSSSPAECWATNEEMVDWMAIQMPKIMKIFREQKLA